MRTFTVYGVKQVAVYQVVEANSKDEAYDTAKEQGDWDNDQDLDIEITGVEEDR